MCACARAGACDPGEEPWVGVGREAIDNFREVLPASRVLGRE